VSAVVADERAHCLPDAKIEASTFDNFYEDLEKSAATDALPRYTGEVGDTWVCASFLGLISSSGTLS